MITSVFVLWNTKPQSTKKKAAFWLVDGCVWPWQQYHCFIWPGHTSGAVSPWCHNRRNIGCCRHTCQSVLRSALHADIRVWGSVCSKARVKWHHKHQRKHGNEPRSCHSMCRWVTLPSDWPIWPHSGGCRAGRCRRGARSTPRPGGLPSCTRTGTGRAAGTAAGRPTPTSTQEVEEGGRRRRVAEPMSRCHLSAHAPGWSCGPQRCSTPPWCWAAGREPHPPIPSSDESSSSSILQRDSNQYTSLKLIIITSKLST